MEFVRKKKRGQSQKVRRMWLSEEGYRITWRKEVFGVRVPARFQACVRIVIPYSGGELRLMWDFVNHRRRLIKTLQAAKEECEKHQSLWTRACAAAGVRALKELFRDKLPTGLPVWAKKKVDRRLYAILTDNRPMKYRDDEEDEPDTESLSPPSDASGPGGPIKTSDPSALPTEPARESDTPALPVEGKEASTTRRTRLKDTETSDASDGTSAKGAGKGRKKPAAKRTKTASKRTAKRKTNATEPASAAKRPKGSRKTKSKPSEN